MLQLDNFRRLVGYGWPGFKSMNLWRQDKGQCVCAAAFVEALRNGGPAPIPQLEVIYCDDVRQEIGKKQRFIGVYPGLIIAGWLPVVLPGLCLVSTLILPRSDEVASARIRIMQGDQCLLESDG